VGIIAPQCQTFQEMDKIMPNYVFNRVSINGTPEQLQKFKDTVKGTTLNGIEQDICFNKILPMPEMQGTTEMVHEQMYNWAVENWGTKWDAYEITLGEDERFLNIYFCTAWSPPEPVMLKLSGLLPELEITHAYIDEFSEFCSIDIYKDGKMISTSGQTAEVMDELQRDLLGYDPEEDEDEEEGEKCTY
jgi:hypothetical protein